MSKLFQIILSLSLIFAAITLQGSMAHSQSNDPNDEMEEDRNSDPGNSDSDTTAEVAIGQVQFGGEGCPAGSANAALSEDKRTVTVLFDNFTASAGGGRPRVSAATCKLRIPIYVRPGYKATVARFDLRGFTSLPKTALARATTFFQITELDGAIAGGIRGRGVHVFIKDGFNDFFLARRAPLNGKFTSCGKSFDLHMTTTLSARSTFRSEETLVTLDSVDGTTAGYEYHLLWRKCKPR